jgi:hypothetical protein
VQAKKKIQFGEKPEHTTSPSTQKRNQEKNKHTMPNNIKSFSVAQVSKWLEELGIPNTSFIQNKIDGSALLKLSQREFIDDYGLTTSDAARLQSELGQTKFSSHHERMIRTLEYLQQENESLQRENNCLRTRNDLLETKIAELRSNTKTLSGISFYKRSSTHRKFTYSDTQ